jgi:electron transport complex protein RnfC
MPGGVFFRHGFGDTDALPSEEFPAPPVVTIPLVQYGETPARPIARPGDHVSAGQMIGEAAGPGGAPVHASVSGVVTDVSRCRWSRDPSAMSVTIENDGRDEFASPIAYDRPWSEAEPAGLIDKIKLSGIVDWNGATGVPVHTRLAAAQGEKNVRLVINFLATEPYCSAGQRLCAGQGEKLAAGIALCMKMSGAASCVMAAGEAAYPVLQAAHELSEVPLVWLKRAKYPLHEERFAARAAMADQRAAPGQRCVVISAAAVLEVRAAIEELMPSYTRTVTVAGPAVQSPKLLTARIGTPVKLLLEACGADFARAKKIVAGGPLSGVAVPDVEMPVTKATAALLALDKTFFAEQQYPCIGCRRCYAVCPVGLEPARLARLARAGNVPELEERGVMECLECGCCSYECPSKVNLVHYVMSGKSLVRARAGAAS